MEMVRRRKYLILIVTSVVALLVNSSTHGLALRSVVANVLVTLVMLAVFLSVFAGRLERNVALAATVVSIAVTWSHHVVPHEHQLAQAIVHHLLFMLFLGFAVVVILGNVLKQKLVTTDEVLGAVAGYLLAAASWANLYALTELLQPGSFSMSQEFAADLPDWHGRAAVFNYFSLVTLTTMGYGDITPARPPATVLATLEAIFGQFYIAIVVAQLVGLRMAQGSQPGDVRR
jgi:voltage-gated potassium channel